MMNIKLYAALAACLGLGYGGGVTVTQRDIERADLGRMSVQCESSVAEQQFSARPPMNSKGMGF